MNKLISICIPCKNRLYDLKKSLPKIINSIEKSSPIEILILNYGSTDNLDVYIKSIPPLINNNFITYIKYMKNLYFHMAHSRNILGRRAKGEYIIPFATDIWFDSGFIPVIRNAIKIHSFIRIAHNKFPGVIVIKKELFISAGGYDERFEFYGKEDKELNERLQRRRIKSKYISDEFLNIFITPWNEKVKNYRTSSRRQMRKINKKVYEENTKNNLLVANIGKEWGHE